MVKGTDQKNDCKVIHQNINNFFLFKDMFDLKNRIVANNADRQ